MDIENESMCVLLLGWFDSFFCVSDFTTIAICRETFIDKNNTWHGRVKMMWSVDQCTLSTDNRTVYYSFTKIGQYAYSPPEEASHIQYSHT